MLSEIEMLKKETKSIDKGSGGVRNSNDAEDSAKSNSRKKQTSIASFFGGKNKELSGKEHISQPTIGNYFAASNTESAKQQNSGKSKRKVFLEEDDEEAFCDGVLKEEAKIMGPTDFPSTISRPIKPHPESCKVENKDALNEETCVAETNHTAKDGKIIDVQTKPQKKRRRLRLTADLESTEILGIEGMEEMHEGLNEVAKSPVIQQDNEELKLGDMEGEETPVKGVGDRIEDSDEQIKDVEGGEELDTVAVDNVEAVKRKVGKTATKAEKEGDALLPLAARQRDYDPMSAVNWKAGEEVPFLFLAKALEEIANEPGRLAITEILCKVFRSVMASSPSDLLAVVYLSANRVAPPHEGLELGIGDSTIMKALAEATGRKEAQIKHEYVESGDLGLVAKSSRLTQRTMFTPKHLTCVKVLEAFRFIAKESGSQSNDKKRARMKQLIVAARESEPQFIVRLLQGKLRIGLAEQTVLAALAHAAVLQEIPAVSAKELPQRLEEAVRIVKQAYSVLPVYEKLVSAILSEGVSSIPASCRFTIGVPVGPMLAKPTRGISEVLDKFQGILFTCEYKYDGERAQVHYLEDGRVEIYSRNAERNTVKYPDIVAAIHKFKKQSVSSFVLDAEAVAYDRETNKILPFQVLSTRARKGVIMSDIKVQICIYAFDLLYINGRELLQEQLVTRRKLLYESFEELKGEFQFATAVTTNDTEEMQMFLNQAVNDSCEGCMVKTLEKDATYEPSKRSNNWLKLKKDYMDDLGDSLDLVPIGAFHGRGKRTGVYGAFLMACYNESTEEFQSICKIGTGFSEAVLEERSTSLKQQIVDKAPSYYRYGESLGVDVWFKAAEVWEVKAADLSISPVHRAASGMVDASKGIALRFPRFLRVREDKAPEQATSAEQVADMYNSQKINHQTGQQDEGD